MRGGCLGASSSRPCMGRSARGRAGQTWGARPADQLAPIPGSDTATAVPRGRSGGQTSMATAAPGAPRAVFKPGGARNKAVAPDPTKQASPGARAAVSARWHRPVPPPPLLAGPALTCHPHSLFSLQQDRHTALSGLLLRAEAAPDPLERMLAVCRCGGAAMPGGGWRAVGHNRGLMDGATAMCKQLARPPFWPARPARRSLLPAYLMPVGPCCTPPQTCCARGAALATRPPPFSGSTTCRSGSWVREGDRGAACDKPKQP